MEGNPQEQSMEQELAKLTQARRERLAFIDFNLFFKGEARREFLTSRFDIAPSVATKDFARYQELVPHNIHYDKAARCHYRSEGFKPLFNYEVRTVLESLSAGFGDGLSGTPLKLVPCEAPYLMRLPDLKIVAVLSEAIYRQAAVKITYYSLSRGRGERIICPHTLVNGGLRWHVRAYDRLSGAFRDFVLTRIAQAQLLKECAVPSEQGGADEFWQRRVVLDLVTHPKIAHPEVIERDYGMKQGHLLVDVRAALAVYLMVIWNIDCTVDKSSSDPACHLALNNPQVLDYLNMGVFKI